MTLSRTLVLDLLRKHLAGMAAGVATVALVYFGAMEPV